VSIISAEMFYHFIQFRFVWTPFTEYEASSINCGFDDWTMIPKMNLRSAPKSLVCNWICNMHPKIIARAFGIAH